MLYVYCYIYTIYTHVHICAYWCGVEPGAPKTTRTTRIPWVAWHVRSACTGSSTRITHYQRAIPNIRQVQLPPLSYSKPPINHQVSRCPEHLDHAASTAWILRPVEFQSYLPAGGPDHWGFHHGNCGGIEITNLIWQSWYVWIYKHSLHASFLSVADQACQWLKGKFG